MSTLLSDILTVVRQRLIEPTAKFWTDDELVALEILGVRDLWRATVDLKQEHYLTINNVDVTLPANSATLSGVPSDVHKVYLIEPLDLTENGNNPGLMFQPLDYNDAKFQNARSRSAIQPTSDLIFYAIHHQGAPVAAPTIYVAPQVTSDLAISFSYVPTLGTLTGADPNPIPGEADNAVIAWTVAYARAKERDDRTPDPGWLQIYGTEKQNLLQSLGLRQYQEPTYVTAQFEEYWT